MVGHTKGEYMLAWISSAMGLAAKIAIGSFLWSLIFFVVIAIIGSVLYMMGVIE